MRQAIGLAAMLMGLGFFAPAVAETPTFFRSDRGLAGNDTLPLTEDFSDAKALVWREPLAPGHSTPCICGDAIYVTTFDAKKLTTVCLDRATGSKRWSKVVDVEKIEKYHVTNSPAAATVACDGKRVFTFFGSFGLVCYGLDGNVLWE